ncbi:hypothetical protein GW17_00053644 [Ensete ventricosum]|nr:hypothetical protein GW17_00053644 [Ensete ventricosum]
MEATDIKSEAVRASALLTGDEAGRLGIRQNISDLTGRSSYEDSSGRTENPQIPRKRASSSSTEWWLSYWKNGGGGGSGDGQKEERRLRRGSPRFGGWRERGRRLLCFEEENAKNIKETYKESGEVEVGPELVQICVAKSYGHATKESVLPG